MPLRLRLKARKHLLLQIVFCTTKPPSSEGGGTARTVKVRPITALLFLSVSFNVFVNYLLELAACLKLIKRVVYLFLQLGVFL